MTRFSRVLGSLFDAQMLVAGLLLLAMVVIVTLDILLRNLSQGAIAWANELSEYMLYLITLLAAPWLLRRGRHVRLDVVLTAVPRRIAWVMEAAGDIVGVVICLVFLRYSATITLDSWRLGSVTIKNLFFPEWWLLAPLPATFVLLAVEFGLRLYRLFGDDVGPRADATSVG